MATVFAVHGTYAHVDGTPIGRTDDGSDKQWWEKGSTFEAELKENVAAVDGALEFEPVVWNGDNSELARRDAGGKLLTAAAELDKNGKSFVMVGHSHGGSVISASLLEAVAKRKPLANLSRWITVGTPFVRLQKEMFLFSRIPLFLQATYVALLLFVVMFLLPMLLGLFASDDVRGRYMGGVGVINFESVNGIATLAFTTLIMSSVFILFYVFLYVMDRRILHMHSPGVIKKAREKFGAGWLGLTHGDDEAVQGLRALGTVDFSIFHKDFFVPVFTAMAVFALPVAYLILIFWPTAMNGLTQYLKTNVYQYESSKAVVADAKKLRDDIRGLRREMRGSGLTLQGCLSGNRTQKPSADMTTEQANAICERWRVARKEFGALEVKQPGIQRTLRFESTYLDPDTGLLQGEGRDTRVNSWMLFNLLNDGITSTFGLNQMRRGENGARLSRRDRQTRRILRLLIPALLVPLLFALSAVAVLFVVSVVARFISGYIAKALDAVTWRQVRRSALGNDTSSEVAQNAAARPHWLEESYTYLPSELADKLTEQSNKAAVQSIGKFRNAISDLAFADAKESNSDIVTEYFTWKELVHSSYFDVPEFRKLVLYAIAQSDGFKPTEKFMADPMYARVAAWGTELKRDATAAAETVVPPPPPVPAV